MVTIRLRRMGATNKAFYRVVVSDKRKAPTAEAIEEIGSYDPRKQPAVVTIDRPRYDYWVKNGAQVSETVKKLVAKLPSAA
jgi:small subunit ribosomal protein S16